MGTLVRGEIWDSVVRESITSWVSPSLAFAGLELIRTVRNPENCLTTALVSFGGKRLSIHELRTHMVHLDRLSREPSETIACKLQMFVHNRNISLRTKVGTSGMLFGKSGPASRTGLEGWRRLGAIALPFF